MTTACEPSNLSWPLRETWNCVMWTKKKKFSSYARSTTSISPNSYLTIFHFSKESFLIYFRASNCRIRTMELLKKLWWKLWNKRIFNQSRGSLRKLFRWWYSRWIHDSKLIWGDDGLMMIIIPIFQVANLIFPLLGHPSHPNSDLNAVHQVIDRHKLSSLGLRLDQFPHVYFWRMRVGSPTETVPRPLLIHTM